MLHNTLIRQLTIAEVDDVFHLRLESLVNSPSSFLTSYEEETSFGKARFEQVLRQKDIGNVIFGAFIENNLVGMLGLVQEKAIKARHKCRLWGMYVQPNYQTQGIGKRLLGQVIHHARQELQCPVINLTVETTNHAALKLYESCGFKTWGIEVKAMQIEGKFYDEAHMALVDE